jgi:RHS repeat-associated protein
MRIENGVARKMYGGFAERSAEDGQLRYYQGDHLGSSTLVTDQTGKVEWQQTYKPFGEDRNNAKQDFTPKLLFTGKEKEQDGTGFYDYGARIYNPATGRWLSADTSTADGLNRYAYVRNNPLGHTDPTGHRSDWASWWAGVKEYASGVYNTLTAPSASEMQMQHLSALASSSPSLHAAVATNEAYLGDLQHRYETGTTKYRAGVKGAFWIALGYQTGLGAVVAVKATPTVTASTNSESHIQAIAKEAQDLYRNDKRGSCASVALRSLSRIQREVSGVASSSIFIAEGPEGRHTMTQATLFDGTHLMLNSACAGCVERVATPFVVGSPHEIGVVTDVFATPREYSLFRFNKYYVGRGKTNYFMGPVRQPEPAR